MVRNVENIETNNQYIPFKVSQNKAIFSTHIYQNTNSMQVI